MCLAFKARLPYKMDGHKIPYKIEWVFDNQLSHSPEDFMNRLLLNFSIPYNLARYMDNIIHFLS